MILNKNFLLARKRRLCMLIQFFYIFTHLCIDFRLDGKVAPETTQSLSAKSSLSEKSERSKKLPSAPTEVITGKTYICFLLLLL